MIEITLRLNHIDFLFHKKIYFLHAFCFDSVTVKASCLTTIFYDVDEEVSIIFIFPADLRAITATASGDLAD